ncbi:unnamed protein product [Acanthoscelides obtectus]|uniref:Gustatory receptor n=1 Tax=Acanthoscelides obtectus TaxID=200917 RepID=A0A9P0K6B6_ACAOB|nr:unnamed protein product [Acanthoscelides obtectus]CAK1643725.1 Gustatory receptor for sugar taste 43a [Acanthoscelides obtectus]
MMLVSVLASDLGGSMQSVRMRDKKGKILTSSDISIVIVNVIFGIAAMPCRMKRYSKILKITGMLMMFSCLIHLIITPYFLLAEVVKPDCDVVFTFLQVVWIATHIARLLIIIEPCQSCSLEGQRTIALLCDLLGKYDITDNTRKIVEVFITQASQQPVKFSCFHLFNLDRSVLTALSGSIATYIVILFQFSTN